MSKFVVMDNLNSTEGWFRAQAISVLESSIATNPIQLRWMINPRILGMPRSAFTVAFKRVAKPSDLRLKTAIANQDDWIELERVGLPLDSSMGCSGYDAGLQGLELDVSTAQPLSLTQPSQAAIRRLELGMPTRGWDRLVSTVSDPNTEWLTPSPKQYVENLLKGPLIEGLCQLLSQQLTPFEAVEFELPLGQDNPPQLTMDVTAETPEFAAMEGQPKSGGWRPLGLMLLAAASDPLAALALGFGTAVLGDLNEMAFRISGEFTLPDLGSVQVADVVWVQDSTRNPPGVKNLQALLVSTNPPTRVDGVRLDSIGLQWDRPPMPNFTSTPDSPFAVSYAIARIGEGGVNPRILLTPRTGLNGWLPYVATKTGDNTPIGFTDHVKRETFPNTPDPFERKLLYFVAAQDIFGRWSEWKTTFYESMREPAQLPTVLGVTLNLREKRNEELPTGAVPFAHDELTVDFSWDWTLRSPQFVELNGMYADAPTQAVLSKQIRFAGNPRPNPLPPDVIPLRQDQTRAVEWGGAQDAQTNTSEPTVRYYRLTMELDVDFAGKEERTFQVRAKGQCALHERAQHGFNISGFGLAVEVTLKNPAQPDAPVLFMPEPLEAPLWATLADTAGLSRIVLRWAPVPRAKEYFLYEATESSLLPTTDTSKPVTDRLARLRSQGPFRAKKSEFQRVNREPILEKNGNVSYEVTLPRGSRVIHIYAVTSKTENQIESNFPQSSKNYFAVAMPRLGVPLPPTLEVKVVGGAIPPRVELVLSADAGTNPSRYEIYRTRREALSKSVDKMGPPVLFADATVEPTTLADEITPGWERVWYRALAWSADDPLKGIVAARSQSSAAISVLLPPDTAPTISDVLFNVPFSTETETLVTWKSDASFARSPYGVHRAVVQGQSAAGAVAIEQTLDQIKTVSSTSDLPPMPSGGEILRLKLGSDITFLARVPRVAADAILNLTLKMIDPLGRIGSTTVRVPQLALLHLPQLSAITFSWAKEIPYVRAVQEGLKAEWEVISFLHEDALSQYKFEVELANQEPDAISSSSFITILDPMAFTLAEIAGPSPLPIQRIPNTKRFSVPIAFQLFSMTVTLTDPLGQAVKQSVSNTLVAVPELELDLPVDEAAQIFRAAKLRSIPAENVIDDRFTVIIIDTGTDGSAGSAIEGFVDPNTKVVDSFDPVSGTVVPENAQILIHSKPVPKVRVPAVLNMHVSSAIAAITAVRLTPRELPFTDPNFDAGRIAHVSPEADTELPIRSGVSYVVGTREDLLGPPDFV